MLSPDELLLIDETEDPADLLRALPEIRHSLEHSRDDELGLRSLLEWPDVGRSPLRAA